MIQKSAIRSWLLGYLTKSLIKIHAAIFFYKSCCFPAAPKILTLEVQEGFNWNIVYVISGLPVPNVTWYRDSLPLLLNNLISDKSVTVEPAYWSRRGCLTFFVTNHMNNGNYTLVADNEFGSAAKTVSAVFLNSPGNLPTTN